MKERTRGTVNQETFNHVKELQKMGASAGKAGRFVGLSPATTSRMYNQENFEDYKEYVKTISGYRKDASDPIPEFEPTPKTAVEELTNSILRLAMAIESNNKNKGLWS